MKKFPFSPLYNQTTEVSSAGGGAATATTAETTQSAATATAPAYFNSDGTLGDNWYQGLGDEFVPHADTLKNFKTVGDIAKSYVHLRKTGPAYPGEASTPDEIARFRTLAKVPGTPQEYGLTKPENLPAGVEWSDKFAGKMAEIAHKYHVPAPALQALMAAQLETEGSYAAQAAQAAQDQQKQAQDALVQAWGSKYVENAAVVRHYTENLATVAGVSPDSPFFAQLANNPDFSKIIMAVAARTSEDGIRAPHGIGDLRSPQQRANAIMNGTDQEWGKKYQERDPEAFRVVARLLTP